MQTAEPDDGPWAGLAQPGPVLNLFWQFWTVIQIGNSLKNEYESRGMRSGDESYGKVVGIILYSLTLVSLCVNVGGRVALEAAREKEIALGVGGLLMIIGLVQLILWIVYWVKIAGFTRELNSSRSRGYDDDYDDRPRRRRYEDDDDRGGRDDRDDRDDDYRPRRDDY